MIIELLACFVTISGLRSESQTRFPAKMGTPSPAAADLSVCQQLNRHEGLCIGWPGSKHVAENLLGCGLLYSNSALASSCLRMFQ